MMNEQESRSNEYLRPPLWHGNIVFGRVALRLSLQKRDAREKGVKSFRHIAQDKLDEPFEHTAPAMRRRLLVLGLYLSLLACLSGLWLTANSPGDPGQLLPNTITNFIATRTVVVLLVPLLSLLTCYFLLRHITYDILAWPERFLDERQQMVRDQAHRYAYKFVKVACILVPLYLCLHAVLWAAQTPATPSPQALTTVGPTEFLIDMAPNLPVQGIHVIHSFPQQVTTLQRIIPPPIVVFNGKSTSVEVIYSIHTMTPPSSRQVPTVIALSWPNNPASSLLYYGVLLLSLLLMATALPMSIVAWKERL